VCEGSTAHFTITANNTGLNYQWQVSKNKGISWTNISGATNVTYSVSNATAAMNGNIYRILAMGQCGIAATSEGALLTINTAPGVLAQPENRSVCAGSGATFGITASGTNLTYQWQLSRDNGATWNDVANARENILNISKTTTGENGNLYHVIISGDCAGSVTSAAAILVVVKPVASFSFQNYCEGVPVAFTNTSTALGTGPVKYTWNFGDGTSSTLTDTKHTFTNAGSYTVQLIATPVGCPFLSDTTEKKVVIEKAVAGVRLPTVNAIANRNIVLQPRDFAVYYKWGTTDGSINSTFKSPEVKLQKEQTVFVNMEFPSGCITTDTLLVRFFKNDDVFVPSAFTPDGDGHNDYLKVIMVQASQLRSLRVFNRWGNLVFETNDPSKGWDGNWKGEKQRGETYLWYCEAIGHDGKIIKKSGNVTLIR
jgi:gliding motility-associated-like protein